MTKPDDIAQDVWNAAYDAMPPAAQGNFKSSPFAMTLHLGFARAIMAERERCIAIVQKTPDQIAHPAGPLFAAGWANAVVAIREAIRKGS